MLLYVAIVVTKVHFSACPFASLGAKTSCSHFQLYPHGGTSICEGNEPK